MFSASVSFCEDKNPGMARHRRHLPVILRLACVASALLMAPDRIGGQEIPWLRGGMVRLDFAPSFWTWDSRFGRFEGTDQEEFLASDLTADPLGSNVLPDLVDVESSLAEALDDPSYRIRLGASRAVVEQSQLVLPFRLEVGVTDWLTVGGMVPLVRPRTELTYSLDAGSENASEGLSPHVTDPSAVRGFLNDFGTAIDGARQIHGDVQAVAEAQAYLDALTRAYFDDTVFPVTGSVPGSLLQQRFDDLASGLTGLGATGIPSSVPLSAGLFDEESFESFLGGPVMRAQPLEDWTTPFALGDPEISVRALLLRRGFEADSLGALPPVRFQLGGGLLLRLGMADQEDPARFFDVEPGDGQMDIETSLFGLLEVGRWAGAWAEIRYGIQSEGEVFRRIAGPDEILPNYSRTAPVRWTPGDYLEMSLNPRFFLTPDMSFGIRYRFWSKGEDSYVLGDVNPDFQDPTVLPPAELLNAETESTLQELGFSATYSSVASYHRGEASLPLHVRITYFHPASGSGGQTPKGGRIQAGLTVFKSLWGGPDRSLSGASGGGPS